MKILIIILSIVLLASCENKNENNIKSAETKVDSAIDLSKSISKRQETLFAKISFLDSNLKYYRLAQNLKDKIYEAELNYIRTSDHKYYKQFYKYQDEYNRLARITNKYLDSLKAK